MRLLSLLVLVPALVLGQTTTASLSGTISDPGGAAVPEAIVEAVNLDTGLTRQTLSGRQGLYALPLLPPGNYKLSVRREGFKPVTRTGITLNVNQAAQIDFQLEIGAVTESVNVTAEAPLLEQSEAALGAVIDNTKVTHLPLNGRNPFDLVLLTPGTQAYSRGALPGNNIPLSNFSTNGGPAMTNEILLDGIPDTTIVQNQFVIIVPIWEGQNPRL